MTDSTEMRALAERLGMSANPLCWEAAAALSALAAERDELARQLSEARLEVENVIADAENDSAHLLSAKTALRALRSMFGRHGIDEHLDWPDWFAAVARHAARQSAAENKEG